MNDWLVFGLGVLVWPAVAALWIGAVWFVRCLKPDGGWPVAFFVQSPKAAAAMPARAVKYWEIGYAGPGRAVLVVRLVKRWCLVAWWKDWMGDRPILVSKHGRLTTSLPKMYVDGVELKGVLDVNIS